MYRLGVVAMTAAFAVAAHGHHHRPGCHKLFTVKMAERLARREWNVLHTPSRHGWKVLLYLARCQRNRQAGHFVHWYYQHQAALNAQRRYAAAHPWHSAYASQYDDGGSHCCGYSAANGVADCGTDHLCYPQGTVIYVCYASCVDATIDDHGPYISGRDLDLANTTAGAIGFPGLGTVRYQVVKLGNGPM